MLGTWGNLTSQKETIETIDNRDLLTATLTLEFSDTLKYSFCVQGDKRQSQNFGGKWEIKKWQQIWKKESNRHSRTEKKKCSNQKLSSKTEVWTQEVQL